MSYRISAGEVASALRYRASCSVVRSIYGIRVSGTRHPFCPLLRDLSALSDPVNPRMWKEEVLA